MKKRLFLCLVLLISITLAACNSDEGNDAENAEGTTENAEKAETDSERGTENLTEKESSESTCPASTVEANNYETPVEGSTSVVPTAYWTPEGAEQIVSDSNGGTSPWDASNADPGKILISTAGGTGSIEHHLEVESDFIQSVDVYVENGDNNCEQIAEDLEPTDPVVADNRTTWVVDIGTDQYQEDDLVLAFTGGPEGDEVVTESVNLSSSFDPEEYWDEEVQMLGEIIYHRANDETNK
ncbi:hypothetical protein [Oceanobacillus jeddahense]|uniref:hypothetical protein n=1 Tax=Oceanobacillus jeddahense TaxID=1462527 RepID=UPI0005963368|nr:hypothetical protein [Oceanobacillus jeddahense]